MSRFLSRRKGLGFVGWMGILIASMGILIPSSHASPPLRVDWEAGNLSVVAQDVALGQLLREIRERTGVGFAVSAESEEKIISASCNALPLVEGIRKVLGSLDYSLEFDAQGRLVRVVILDARAVSDSHLVEKGLEEGRTDSDDPTTASTGLESGAGTADPMSPRVRARGKPLSGAPSPVDIQIRGSFEFGGRAPSPR